LYVAVRLSICPIWAADSEMETSELVKIFLMASVIGVGILQTNLKV